MKIKQHSYFKREAFDIYTTNFITISQAVLGGKIKVRTLYGDVSINIDPGTNDGDTKKLLNYVKKFKKILGYYQTCAQPKSERPSLYKIQNCYPHKS